MAPRNPYYCGPVSDHFDGVRFFNPSGPRGRSLGDLARWQFNGERVRWPPARPNRFRDRPPERVTGHRLRASFVGHATVLLQLSGLNVLTDPVWSRRVSPFRSLGPSRVAEPGIAFPDLPPIDLVLLSHNHYDHMDVATLKRLFARDRPRIVTPLGNDTILARYGIAAEAHDWGDTVAIEEDAAVTLLPAQHWSARWLRDRSMALWSGFALRTPAGNVYFAGDTGFADGVLFERAREAGPFRLALLPIGAYEPRWFMRHQHMDPEEAVQAFRLLGAEHALGIHFGTFQLTDEGIDAPVEALAEALAREGIPPKRFRALGIGEAWEVP